VSRSSWSRALLIVSAAAVVRLLFAAIIPLFPDETYYWDWSRHLAPGYFDHPGGIAFLIKLGAMPSAVGVRIGAVVAGWTAAIATVAIARALADEEAALRAAVVITVMPLAAAGLILATPDSPLLAATALGLYCVVRALRAPVRSSQSLRWWIFTGIALGAAFTSKYTSIFLPVGVVLAILLRRELRPRLAEPGPYVACAIATLLFVPVLLWNAQHEWISFLFQIKHGLSKPEGSALRAAWRHEGDFFGGQAGLASPILFIMLGIATWRGLKTRDARFVLAMVALTSFGFFFYSALRQRVEPNWPAPAYIPAIVLLAITDWGAVARKWLKGGLWFAAAMSLLIYAQGVLPILPIPPRKDPIGRAFGWTDVARVADSTARAATAESHAATWLGGDRYQEASELAFQIPSHPATFATNLSGRANQYDLWPRYADRAQRGDNLVLVLDDSDERDPHDAIKALLPHFAEARRGALVSLKRGAGEIGTRRIWTLFGWRGTWPASR
jgi:4-amino-4-deoxy-L-arabinose transferase-like glycosyltransferase